MINLVISHLFLSIPALAAIFSILAIFTDIGREFVARRNTGQDPWQGSKSYFADAFSNHGGAT